VTASDALVPTLIISEGAGYIAINKPSGMSTHNDASSGSGSQTDALSYVIDYLKKSSKLADEVSPVHRLDRETSGVLLFATTKQSASRLQRALADDVGTSSDSSAEKTKKFYRAVLRGKLSGQGVWDFPISDKAEGRENPAGKSHDRKTAVTKFEVLRASDFLTEVRIELLTGRQHQIRKHARLAKHGIVGDRRYGELSHARKMESLYSVSRLMLHAERLELLDLKLTAPVPPEFDLFF
jgi:23S rRNA-/tRNA-specific pseudouridylate synthase